MDVHGKTKPQLPLQCADDCRWCGVFLMRYLKGTLVIPFSLARDKRGCDPVCLEVFGREVVAFTFLGILRFSDFRVHHAAELHDSRLSCHASQGYKAETVLC